MNLLQESIEIDHTDKFNKLFGYNLHDLKSGKKNNVKVLIIGPSEVQNRNLSASFNLNIGGSAAVKQWTDTPYEQKQIINDAYKRDFSTVILWNDSDILYISPELIDNIDYVFFRSGNPTSVKLFVSKFKLNITSIDDPIEEAKMTINKFINRVIDSDDAVCGYVAFKMNHKIQNRNADESAKTCKVTEVGDKVLKSEFPTLTQLISQTDEAVEAAKFYHSIYEDYKKKCIDEMNKQSKLGHYKCVFYEEPTWHEKNRSKGNDFIMTNNPYTLKLENELDRLGYRLTKGPEHNNEEFGIMWSRGV